jgi:ArsR family transcriptional regulator
MVVDIAAEHSTEVLKALAEPARRRIVERLAVEELCVCHLVEDLDLPQPLVSHHLKVLRDAGVVSSERYKQWIYYRAVPGALAKLGRDLTALAKTSRTATRNRRPCC